MNMSILQWILFRGYNVSSTLNMHIEITTRKLKDFKVDLNTKKSF